MSHIWIRWISCLTAIMLMSSCSSFSRFGLFKDSTLNNLNPAPQKFSPPMVSESQIDPTYMRTQADYHYALGVAYSLDGKTEQAVDAFKLTLIYDPSAVAVRVRLAAEYFKSGLYSEAIEQAEMAVEADDKNVEARMLLGGLYSTVKMYDLAIVQYQMVSELDSENQDAPLYISLLLTEQKKYTEASKLLQELIRKESRPQTKASYYLYLGSVYEEQGDAFKAKVESAYNKALSLNPRSSKATVTLAKFYIENEQEHRAVKLLSGYQVRFGPKRNVARLLSQIHLKNDNYAKAMEQIEVLESFDRTDLNIKLRLALIYMEVKKFGLAVNKLQEVLAIDPRNDKIYFYLGAVYEEMGQQELAVNSFLQVSAGSRFFAESVIHAAHALKAMGQNSQANEVIRQAIEKRDDVPQFYAFYASLLEEQNQVAAAIALLTDSVKKFPSHTQLHFFLGSMYDRAGQPKKTVEHMELVIQIDQQHVQALNYLAYTLAEMNSDLPRAEKLVRRALDLKPEDAYILDTMGWVLFKQQRFQDSLQFLEAAYRVKSDESVIAEHLADVYVKMQLMEKARVMYKKALGMSADGPDQQRIRAKLIASEVQQPEFKRQPASSARAESKSSSVD